MFGREAKIPVSYKPERYRLAKAKNNQSQQGNHHQKNYREPLDELPEMFDQLPNIDHDTLLKENVIKFRTELNAGYKPAMNWSPVKKLENKGEPEKCK